MKQQIILISSILIILISSCKISYVKVQVRDPAQIDIPPEMTGMAMINRTVPEIYNVSRNTSDSVTITEIPDPDIEAANICIDTLVKSLQDLPRFRKVISAGEKIRTSGNSKTQSPMKWDEIANICLDNQVSCLLSLETFKSEMNKKVFEQKKIIADGEEISSNNFKAVLSVDIISGWRIYDPRRRRFFNETLFKDSLFWENTGNTKEEALKGLPDKEFALKETAINTGLNYAERFSPVYFLVKRKYYIKGDGKFEKAAEFAKAGEWRKAAGIWERIAYKEQNKLIASHASYNMAVAEEINGRVYIALSWVRKSNKMVPKNSTLKYINILNKRVLDLDTIK